MASNALEMQGFQYVNEDSIDIDLKCCICLDVLFDPGTLSPCNHSFCRTCIAEKVENSTICPKCLKTASNSNRESGNDILLERLSELLVQCDYCNQMNIERGDFDVHVSDLCPKAVVCCTASGHQCTWMGPRDERATHLTECTAALKDSLGRELLDVTNDIKQLQRDMRKLNSQEIDLRGENRQFKPHIERLDQHWKTLQNDNLQLKLQVKTIADKNKSLHLQINNLVTNNRHLDLQVFDLTNEKQHTQIQINDLLAKNRELECQVKQLLDDKKGLRSILIDLEAREQPLKILANGLQTKNQQFERQVIKLENDNIVLQSNLEALRAEQYRKNVQSNNSAAEKEQVKTPVIHPQQRHKPAVFSQTSSSGVTTPPQCTAWAAFQTLLVSGSYSSLTISGDSNPSGITLINASIVTDIAQALRLNTSYGSAASSSYSRIVGSCSSAFELIPVTDGVSKCDPVYMARPSILNSNKGAIKATTSSTGSQTATVTTGDESRPSSRRSWLKASRNCIFDGSS